MLKVREKGCPPGVSVPDVQKPLSEVVVWGTKSLLLHTTVSPAVMVISLGSKRKSWMETVTFDAKAPGWPGKLAGAAKEITTATKASLRVVMPIFMLIPLLT